MIRLLIVDDHPVVSAGLAGRFAVTDGFEVAGTASTIGDALYFAASHAFDVAVVDVQLDTLLTARQVDALAQRGRVVLFSALASSPLVRQLLDAGATAVVDKATPLAELDALLREVAAGRPATTSSARPSATREVLSAREFEVYRALARCQTPKEVAASLGIARSTVYCHIENLRRKLGVQTLQEIVARACGEVE